MRRLVLKADVSVDGFLSGERTPADWPHVHYDEELERYQRRVVEKAGVHALAEAWTVDALEELKRDGGAVDELPPIVTEGGPAFCQELTRRRLVDEYRIVVHPVVFGEGHRLFAAEDRFHLIGTRFFGTGSLGHTYVPLEKYQDHPPPYPWAASPGSEGPDEDQHDPEA